MYDTKILSNIIDEIYSLVGEYISYLEYSDSSDDYEKNDVIILYKQDDQLCYMVKHFNDYIVLDTGNIALSHLSTLVINSASHHEPDYDKIEKLVYDYAAQDIPLDVIEKAKELSKDYPDSAYTIEFHHQSLDGSHSYLCEFYEMSGLAYIIRKQGNKICAYVNIEPFAHSVIPNQVLDFLCPNTNEYTYIRHVGEYKGEDIFYPCHEYSMLADGCYEVVNVLVGFDKNTNLCRYITGELANMIYYKLDRLKIN